MKRTWNRSLSWLLAIIMALGLLPVTAFAGPEDPPVVKDDWSNVYLDIATYRWNGNRIQGSRIYTLAGMSPGEFSGEDFKKTVKFGEPVYHSDTDTWTMDVTVTGYDPSDITSPYSHAVNYMIRGASFNGWGLAPDADATKTITLTYIEKAGNKSGWYDADSDVAELPFYVAPLAPDEVTLETLLSGQITVDCTTDGANHPDRTYGLIKNGYTTGKVTGEPNNYTYTITLDADAYAAYYDSQNSYAAGTHTPASTEDPKITFKWNTSDRKWEVETTPPVTIEVECTTTPTPTEPAITGFTKELMDSKPDGVTIPGGITYPTGDKVTIPAGGSVTLLYKLTVTGKPGTSFTITDDGATLVGSSNCNITSSGSASPFAGTIIGTGDNVVATLYVTKTFTADDIDSNGKVINNANVGTGDEGGLAEGVGGATAETPAEEGKPSTPDNDDLDSLLSNQIKVECITTGVSHDDKTYGLIEGGYTLPPAVTGNATDGWTYVITLVPSAYVEKYNTDIGTEHELDPDDQTGSITLTWDNSTDSWTLPTSGLPVTFTVKCGTTPTPTEPSAPGDDDLNTILGNNVVTVECTNSDVSHADKTYGLIENGYTPGTVAGNLDDGYTYTITLDADAYADHYDSQNSYAAGTHTAVTGNPEITFKWNTSDRKWEVETTLPVTIEVKCETYTLTYDANGGTVDGRDTFTVSGISATENYELGKEPSYTAPTRAGMVFMGWTTDESAKNEVYAAGEKIPDLVTTVKIPDTTTVYAVWGEDENGDGTADALQIVITPADITVYAGGASYKGVVEDQDGNLVADSESTGLPEPGYYFTLPYELDQYLKGQFGTTAGQPVNLAQHIRLQDKTDESRMWILELYDGAETSSAGGRYIYRLAETATGNSPAKLQISDGNDIVTSDEFFISSSALYQEYQMSLYTGAASQGNIIVEVSEDGSQWNDLDDLQGVGTVKGLSLTKGTLTVRGEDNTTPTLTTEVVSNEDAIGSAAITAVAGDGVEYHINDSTVVTNGTIALYTDGLLPNNVLENYLKDKGILSDTAQVDYQYLDLVDASNGNAYVTTDRDVAIYWKLPADADPDGTFHIVHFSGLDRNYDVGDLGDLIGTAGYKVKVYSTDDGTLTLEEINGEQYLTFTTSTFSPFALVYDAKDAPQPDDDTYTLTYAANALGGTVSGMPTPNPETGLNNGSHTLSSTEPTHSAVNGTDVVFIGWTETPTSKIFSKNDTAPDTITTITINGTDEIVYAAWGYDVNGNGTPDVEETKYTLTYHANYRGNDDTIEYVYVAGEEVTVKGRLFSRSGYAFDEWNTRSSGRGTSYDRGDVFTMPAHDEDLYAQWTPRGSGDDDDDSYAVYYHPGYGKDVRKLDAFYEVGETVEVLDNEWFQRDGYVFIGWSRTPGGSAPDDLPGDTFKMPSGTVDLYALWEEETTGSTAADASDWLNTEDHYAYIVGYEDGTVRPEGYLTRAEVATIFFRLLTDEARERFWSTQNSYSDVAVDAWYNNAISTMTRAGILGGYEDNTFRPNNSITRAEFAAIAARFDSGAAAEDCGFTDIAGHWAEAEICRAVSLGWLQGYGDGTFRPDQPITRAEVMTIINRMLDRSPEDETDLLPDMNVWSDNRPGAWYYLAVQEATNSHTYVRKDGGYETWVVMRENPDWTRYQ